MHENKSAIMTSGRQTVANLATAIDHVAVYVQNYNACGHGRDGADPVQQSDLTPPPQYGAQS